MPARWSAGDEAAAWERLARHDSSTRQLPCLIRGLGNPSLLERVKSRRVRRPKYEPWGRGKQICAAGVAAGLFLQCWRTGALACPQATTYQVLVLCHRRSAEMPQERQQLVPAGRRSPVLIFRFSSLHEGDNIPRPFEFHHATILCCGQTTRRSPGAVSSA
jgi:hypothetical protein